MIKGTTVILPPAYMAPAAYYAAMVGADCIVIDTGMRYDRRAKAVHRTIVDGAHGSLFLTVPVTPPKGRTWHDVGVSSHGRWWHVQTSTLATLFGPTPFFDYYRADITASMTEDAVGLPITDLDIAIDMQIRRLLGITAAMSVAVDPRACAAGDIDSRSQYGQYGDDSKIVDMRRVDFYNIEMPAELYPGRSVLRALFELGGDEVYRSLVHTDIAKMLTNRPMGYS